MHIPSFRIEEMFVHACHTTVIISTFPVRPSSDGVVLTEQAFPAIQSQGLCIDSLFQRWVFETCKLSEFKDITPASSELSAESFWLIDLTWSFPFRCTEWSLGWEFKVVHFRGLVCGNRLEGRKKPAPPCEERAASRPHSLQSLIAGTVEPVRASAAGRALGWAPAGTSGVCFLTSSSQYMFSPQLSFYKGENRATSIKATWPKVTHLTTQWSWDLITSILLHNPSTWPPS